MLLEDLYDGSTSPFEGDFTVFLQSLPADAKVSRARLEVRPVGTFEEVLDFSPNGEAWGAQRVETTNFSEVSFRRRRTVAAIDSPGGLLHADLGAGVYFQVNTDGTVGPGPGSPLTVAANQPLPALGATRVKVQTPGRIRRVTVHSTALNLSLRIGDQQPLWTRPGELTGPETVPDFADSLRQFLEQAKPENGYFVIPFTFRTDSICRLSLRLTLEYVREQAGTSTGVGQAKLTYGFDSLPNEAGLLKVKLKPGEQVSAAGTRVSVLGRFLDTRVGFETTGDGATDAEVTPTQSFAQPIMLPNELNVTGIDLLLRIEDVAAQLQIDLRNDLGERPGLQSLLPAPLTVDVHREHAEQWRWVSVPLAAAKKLKAGERVWLWVQSLDGKVRWRTDAGPDFPHLFVTTNHALSWDPRPDYAFFRLRISPPQFTIPIAVDIQAGGETKRLDLSEYAPLGRVEFSLDSVKLAATINAVASKNVPLTADTELLDNGDFEVWVPGAEALMAVPPPNGQELQVLAVGASPDGSAAYVLRAAGSSMVARLSFLPIDPVCRVVDETKAILAPDKIVEAVRTPIAVSPDGQLAFSLHPGAIVVWDLAARTARRVAIACPNDATGAAANFPIQSIAAGRTEVFIGVLEKVYAVPVADFDQESIPLPGKSVAVGRQKALAVASRGQLAWLNDESVTVAGSPPIALAKPTAFACRADGQVMVAFSEAVAVYDPATGEETARFATARGLSQIALPAAAQNWMVGIAAEGRLWIGRLGRPQPDAWTLSAGAALPIAQNSHFLALLDAEGADPPATLSQVTAVAAGKVYELSFLAASAGPGAIAQILWRGSACEPFQPQKHETIEIAAGICRGPRLHRRRVTAPSGATQAEIRFRVPARALIDQVSFRMPSSEILNGDLAEGATGWTVTAPPDFAVKPTLVNQTASPIHLAQTVTLPAGTPYRLAFNGTATARGYTPVVEVAWDSGDALRLALQPNRFGQTYAEGISPKAATSGTLRLTVPAGASLDVRKLAVERLDLTEVGLTVVAEAPGDLTISEIAIATEQAPPRRPLPPAAGPCPPTSPAVNSPMDEDCGCGCGPGETATPKATATVAGPHVAAGAGPISGAILGPIRFMPSVLLPMPTFPFRPILNPARFVIPAVEAPVIDTPPIAAPVAPAAAVLTDVKGIGPNRARLLESEGVRTLNDLVQFTPDRLAKLFGIAPEKAATMLEDAAIRARP